MKLTQRVDEVMNHFPILVDQNSSLMEALTSFKRKKVSHLLVVASNRLVGVLSKEDLLNKMIELATDTPGKQYNQIMLTKTPVSKIMSKNLLVAKNDDLLSTTVQRMLEAQVHCIPVINSEGEPIGILNPVDFLSAFIASESQPTYGSK